MNIKLPLFNNQLYLLIAIVTIFSGCDNNSRKPSKWDSNQNNTYITGQVLNKKSSTIRLYSTAIKDTVALNKEGTFLFNFQIKEAQYFQIITKSKTINAFISPGDSIALVMDDAIAKYEVALGGVGINETQYLTSKYQLMLDMAIPMEHLYKYPPQQFKFIIDSSYIVHKINLDAFIEKHPQTSPNFIEKEKASILYERATKMYEYASSSNYTQLGSSFYSFEKQTNPNDSSLLTLYDYKTYLKAMVNYKAKQHLKRVENIHYTPQEFTLAKLQMCSKYIDNKYTKDFVLYSITKEHVGFYGYKNIDTIIQIFEIQCTNDSLKQIVLEPYLKYYALTQKEKAPNIEFYDLDSKTYTLESFKGSFLYIDIWATWCLPCRKLAPHFKNLAISNQQKNITFISLSIDKKEKDWIEYLAIKNLTHHQYIIKDIDVFVEDYQIKTIPHFLIIDPEGKILNANAPRPDAKNKQWLDDIPKK